MASNQRKRCLSSGNNNDNQMVMDKDIQQLPSDLSINILLRLPVKSLCCLRCVSKTSLAMIDDHSFQKRYSRLLASTTSVAEVPRLMFYTTLHDQSFEENGHSVALQSVKYDGGILTKGNFAVEVSRSEHKTSHVFNLVFVFCNLFGFTHFKSRLILMNPLKGEVLRLPAINLHHVNSEIKRNYYGMGFDTIANTYKIVCATRYLPKDPKWIVCATRDLPSDPEKWTVQVFVLGTNSWRDISSAPPSPCPLDYLNGVSAYGDVHWLTENSSIVSFDFKKEEFYCIPHPLSHSGKELIHLHMLTFRGCLALVNTLSSTGSTVNMEIWILRDFGKKQWAHDYTINREMPTSRPMFGSYYYRCGEWEHGIFFKEYMAKETWFVYLRSDSMNVSPVTNFESVRSRFWNMISSFSGGLISLKDYDYAVEAEGSGDLNNYSKLIEGEGQGLRLSQGYMLRRVSSI